MGGQQGPRSLPQWDECCIIQSSRPAGRAQRERTEKRVITYNGPLPAGRRVCDAAFKVSSSSGQRRVCFHVWGSSVRGDGPFFYFVKHTPWSWPTPGHVKIRCAYSLSASCLPARCHALKLSQVGPGVVNCATGRNPGGASNLDPSTRRNRFLSATCISHHPALNKGHLTPQRQLNLCRTTTPRIVPPRFQHLQTPPNVRSRSATVAKTTDRSTVNTQRWITIRW